MITTRQWQQTKDILKTTLTQGAYRRWLNRAELLPSLNGSVRIGVPDEMTVEWCTARLMKPVSRAVEQITGEAPEIIFEVSSSPAPEHGAERNTEMKPALDFLPVWRKTGYSQLAHYVTRFWVPYLSPNVFSTWKALETTDTRPLEHPENRWTLPREYSYRQLARHIGARSHKTISGRKDECGVSRNRRLAGTEITATCPACPHPVHQLAPGADEINRCKYWRPGTLEILFAEKLLALDVRSTEGALLPSFTLSVYRVLPLLTPAQADRLPPTTRREHLRWLRHHEKTTGITLELWRSIAAATLVPRQPGYALQPLHGYYQFNRILMETPQTDIHENTELGRTAPPPPSEST